MKTIVIVVVIFVLLSLWGFYFAIRPFRITSSVTPANFGIPFEEVSFRTEDNILIHGWFIPSKKPNAKTIILLHGYPADKSDILPINLSLHDHYNLLFFDFRYFGKSEGWYSTIGKDEVLDLLAAIQYLHSRKINEVGVWGFSLGGAVALMSAPNAPEIKAIIAQSSYARLDWLAYQYYPIPILGYVMGELMRFWGALFFQFDIKTISPAISAAKLNIPILLIYSKQDQLIPIKHGLLMQQMLRHNPNFKMIIVDQGQHGALIPNEDKIVKEFFEQYLVQIPK